MDEKVVDLVAFRATVRARRSAIVSDPVCPHNHIIVDEDAGTIECSDCQKSLSAFIMLVRLAHKWHVAAENFQHLKKRAALVRQTISTYKIRMRALKAFEKSWWRGGMVPCCPHCGRGLMERDFADGAATQVSREYEMAIRKRKEMERGS